MAEGTLLDSPVSEIAAPSCSGSAGRGGIDSEGPRALTRMLVLATKHDNDSGSEEGRSKGNTPESSILPTSPGGMTRVVAELEDGSARSAKEVESSRPVLMSVSKNGNSSSERKPPDIAGRANAKIWDKQRSMKKGGWRPSSRLAYTRGDPGGESYLPRATKGSLIVSNSSSSLAAPPVSSSLFFIKIY